MGLFSKICKKCKCRKNKDKNKLSKIDKKELKKEEKLEKKAIKSENLAHKKAQKKLSAKKKLRQRAQENRGGAKARAQRELLPRIEQNAPHFERHEQEEWDLPSPNVMPLTVFEKLEMERAKRCPSGPCDQVENVRLPPIDYYGKALVSFSSITLSRMYFFVVNY